MSDKTGQDLGEVLTLIDGAPIKFSVTAYAVEGSARWALAVEFREWSRPAVPELKKFRVLIEDSLVSADYGSAAVLVNDADRNKTAVGYGLYAVRDNPAIAEIYLSHESLEEFRSRPLLRGKTLEYELLSFFLAFYRLFPQEGIGIPDLIENFPCQEEHLKEWVAALREKEFLVFHQADKGYPRERGFGFSMRPYRLNPKMEDAVQEYLNRPTAARNGNLELNQPVKVFLSYSTRDKKLAGLVMKELESYGCEVFLAHEKIEPSDEWKEKILTHLQNCDVFVPLITKDFKESRWCDQESGIAHILKKIIMPLRVTENPYGFVGKYQALQITYQSVRETCTKLVRKLETLDRLRGRLKSIREA